MAASGAVRERANQHAKFCYQPNPLRDNHIMYKYSRINNKLKTVGIIIPSMSATVSSKALQISQITKFALKLNLDYVQTIYREKIKMKSEEEEEEEGSGGRSGGRPRIRRGNGRELEEDQIEEQGEGEGKREKSG